MALKFLNSGYFAGKVGIGTESPGEKLAVKGDASYIEITHPTATSYSGIKFSEGGTPQGSIQNIGSTFATVARRGNFEIFHNTGGNLTLQHSGGNVGIGTTSPSQKLQINGAVYSTLGLYSDHTYSSNRNWRIITNSFGAGSWGGIAIKTSTGAGLDPDTTRFGIDYLGNIGIGTTSPGTVHGVSYGTTKLHIDGGTDRGQLVIEGDTSAAIVLSDNGATANQRVFSTFVDGGSYNIKPLSDNGTSTVGGPAITVLHSGNVGIGVTSPGAKLDIVGSTIGLRIKKADLSDVLRVYTQGSGTFMDGGNVHISDDLKIGATLLSNQENTDVDSAAAEVVAQVAISYTAAFFDFVVKKGTNVRSGTVYACHDGTNVEFTETSTNDLGDTSDVTLSVDISGTNMRLLATVTSDDWSVKSLIRAI